MACEETATNNVFEGLREEIADTTLVEGSMNEIEQSPPGEQETREVAGNKDRMKQKLNHKSERKHSMKQKLGRKDRRASTTQNQ